MQIKGILQAHTNILIVVIIVLQQKEEENKMMIPRIPRIQRKVVGNLNCSRHVYKNHQRNTLEEGK
jgi:hypothetical protein